MLHNIVVCQKSKNLYIIDFGEAEYLQDNADRKIKEELQCLASTILEMAKVCFIAYLNSSYHWLS